MSETDDIKQESRKAEQKKRLVCLFLDGLGVAADSEVNAVRMAKMPNLAKYVKNYPVSLLSSITKDERRRYWALGSGMSADNDLFPQAKTTLSSILSDNGYRQLKICASEQSLLLNLFFNNYKEISYLNEDRICLNTPGIDESLVDFTKNLIKLVKKQYKNNSYDTIFASLPSIHEAATRGGFTETVKNLELMDKLLPKIIDLVLVNDDLLVLCSPYGNAERTKDLAADWEDKTATNNPVPLVIIGNAYEGKTIGLADPLEGDLSVLAPSGILADFAPTILSLLNLDQSTEMEGESLI